MASAKNSKRLRSNGIDGIEPQEHGDIVEACDKTLGELECAIGHIRIGYGLPAVWKLSISATDNGFFSREALEATEVHRHQVLRHWLAQATSEAWKAITIVKVGSMSQRPAVFFLSESPFGERITAKEIGKLALVGISLTMSTVSGTNPLAGLLNDRLKEDVECLDRAMNAKNGALSRESVQYAMRVKERITNIREVLDTLEEMYEI
jgi:hypothetical protein